MEFDRIATTRRIQCILAAAAGILGIPLLHWALRFLIPDAGVDPEFLRRTFAVAVDDFRPEPVEKATFICSIALIPPLLLAVIFLSGAYLRRLSDSLLRAVERVVYGGSLAAVLIFCLRIPSDVIFFVQILHVSRHPTIVKTAGFLVTFVAILWCGRRSRSQVGRRTEAYIVWFMFAGTVLAMLPFVFSNGAEIPEDYLGTQNLDAVTYTIAQVVYGRALLVNQVNLYGLYAQMIEPFFRLAGLSISTLTILMWLLDCLCYGLLLVFLRRSIRSTLVMALTYTSVAYYGYLSALAHGNEPYFQYHPVRMLFPCLGLFLFSRYIRQPSRLTYWLSLTSSLLAILWNPDTGVVVCGTWLILLASREFAACPPGPALRNMLGHGWRTAICAVGIVAVYCVYIFSRYRAWPDFGQLFWNTKIYYSSGYMMMPMPSPHPWALIAALYIFGTAKVISDWIHRENVQRAQLVMTVVVMGSGLFTYYQGRSHDYNLIFVVYPAIVLLGLLTDEALEYRRRAFTAARPFIPSLSFCGALLVLSFPLVLWPSSLVDAGPFLSDRIGALLARHPGWLSRDAEFIAAHSRDRAPVAILSYRAGMYHIASQTRSYFDGPGLTEMLLRTQEKSLLGQISAMRREPIFLDIASVGDIHFPYEISSALLREWRAVDHNLASGGDLVLFQRRPANEQPDPASWQLGDDSENPEILHLRRDSSGFLVDRMGQFAGFQSNVTGHAIGSGTLTLEALIRPDENEIPLATAIGTSSAADASRGFAVRRTADREHAWEVALGNGTRLVTGPSFTLPPGKISYLCILVHGERAEIYRNGESAGVFEIPGGLTNSEFPVTIGNWEDHTRPIRGTVPEVYIGGGSVTPASVLSRWRAISEADVP